MADIAPLDPAIAPEKTPTATTAATPDPPAVDSGDQAPATDNPMPRAKSVMRAKVGSQVFSSLEGQILGQPWIRLRTHQYSDAKFMLVDPDGGLWTQISGEQDVEIEIGFVGGESENVFVGKIWAVSRVPPDGTLVEAVDPSAQMQSAGNSVTFQNEQTLPADPAAQVTDTATQGSGVEANNGTPAPVADPNSAEPQNSPTPAPQGGLTDTPEDAADGWAAMQRLLGQVGEAVRRDRVAVAQAEQTTNAYPGLKFADDRALAGFRQGAVRAQQGDLAASTQAANAQGDVVVTRGNTVRQVAPGAATPSGIVLDYTENRSAFIGKPQITKRSGLQLAGPVGALTVAGWSPNDKTVVSATVVTPGATPGHPTGNITVPDWGSLNLSDPIFPGCVYTWNDATKNGTRVPTREVMQRIVAIAQVVQPLTDQTVGQGKKWTITSWYRDPASNRRAGGASRSRHLNGDAIDCAFPGMMDLHRSLSSTYEGGLAIKPGSFIHIDARGSRSRWTY